MIIWPHIAEYCVNAMGYVTTAFVAVRLGYSAKGAVENFMKIKTGIKNDGVSAIADHPRSVFLSSYSPSVVFVRTIFTKNGKTDILYRANEIVEQSFKTINIAI